jgi:hypothetical protein
MQAGARMNALQMRGSHPRAAQGLSHLLVKCVEECFACVRACESGRIQTH